MPFRTPSFFHALLAVCLAFLATRLALAAPTGENRESRNDEARALVVLIGEAAKSDELTAVLSELLERERVALEFERKSRFRPSALLASSGGDPRVWVFISSTKRVAKLYFRGPFGNRFLLRKLDLQKGLDEVGRELIAQVVETSISTLLRSEAGLSREQLKADLSHASEPDENSAEATLGKPDEAATVPAPPSDRSAGESPAKSAASPFELELGARGVAKWTGGDLGADHGAGAEAALAYNRSRGFLLRARLLFEYGFGQGITTPALSATVRTTALRAGVDFGPTFGKSALVIGLGFGVDLARITPETARDASLVLAESSSATTPVARLEARYELTSGIFRMAAGLFGDAPLVDTHYDVRGPGGLQPIAEPWPIRPGVLVVLGFCFGL